MWYNKNTCYYRLSSKLDDNLKIAMFDFDGTLVFPLKGYHPINPQIKGKLHEFKDRGYHLVIFSNQHGVFKGKTTISAVQERMDNFMEHVGLGEHFSAFYSTAKDYYRKPLTGMYSLFLELMGNPTINYSKSFYIGDASGRKGDFSDSDLNFAHNISCLYGQLRFCTPEKWLGLDETSIMKQDKYQTENLLNIPVEKQYPFIPDNTRSMIILTGPQGSGKSIYASYYANNYDFQTVSGDLLKTKGKIVKQVKTFCNQGLCLTIDKTNPSRADRDEWIHLAKTHGYKVYIIFIDVPKLVSRHMVQVRQHKNGPSSSHIPDIAIHKYYKNLEKPENLDPSIQVFKVGLPPLSDIIKPYVYYCRYSL